MKDRMFLKMVVGSTIAVFVVSSLLLFWGTCRIEVPKEHFAVLIKRTGAPLSNDAEVSPSADTQGVQQKVLTEGRYFLNPYNWDWRVYPMVQVPIDKMGVRIRLHGDDLPYSQFLAKGENEKGIIEETLKPGRYAINAMVTDGASGQEVGATRSARKDYVEIIELWDPKVIPAGYIGVVANLAGEFSETPNAFTVSQGNRGTQKETFPPGTYYRNPYIERINALDMRSLRFSLSEKVEGAEAEELSFPSKDGFPIELDGIIEFRLDPKVAPETYVIYNELENDSGSSANVVGEIIRKVILPNARSFCRIEGSNKVAREFIGGETRAKFQEDFQAALTKECKGQGVIIEQALITKVSVPEAIAEPLRNRELAVQQRKQFTQEILQQEQEALLQMEKRLVDQKTKLIEAEQEVVKQTTSAMQEQLVDVERANQDKEVAEKKLSAATDQATAIKVAAEAKAAVIRFGNEADAAGWKAAVKALGSGESLADYTLYKKIAPNFEKIMTNTGDSPFMKLFEGKGEQHPKGN